uniref:Uncharacterized protein n=1 Tax=Anguilla anguilla TaxID=7936 RepID=A0A0E9RKX3_ANGAN
MAFDMLAFTFVTAVCGLSFLLKCLNSNEFADSDTKLFHPVRFTPTPSKNTNTTINGFQRCNSEAQE